MYANEVFHKIKEEKKSRIIDAAIQEFSAHGFSKANINIIATEASVSVGSLYKYFDNKHNLYLFIVSKSVEIMKNVLNIIIVENNDLEQTIRNIIKAIQKYSRTNANSTKLYNVMASENDPELVAQLAKAMEGATADVYAQLIERYQSTGQLSKDIHPRYFAYFLDNIFMMLQFSYSCPYYKERMKIFINDHIFDDDQILEDELIRFILNQAQ